MDVNGPNALNEYSCVFGQFHITKGIINDNNSGI